MPFLSYLWRRVVYSIILLLAVIILNFCLIHIAPGDPADVIAGEMGGATAEMLAAIRAIYGLDRPLHEQLGRYLSKMMRGDLGHSFFFDTPVTALILARVGPTIVLVVSALLVAITVGTLLGVIASRHPHGLFSYVVGLVSRVAKGRDWVNAVGGAEALDEAIRTLYRRRWALTLNAAGQMLAWTLGAAEIWLALYFMDIPVTIADALLLESLILAVRAAAFFVPGAVGVQEGAFVLLGAVIGLGPEVALALSLIKRVRELVIGAPALIAWQVAEGKHLFSPRRVAAARAATEEALPQPVLEPSSGE